MSEPTTTTPTVSAPAPVVASEVPPAKKKTYVVKGQPVLHGGIHHLKGQQLDLTEAEHELHGPDFLEPYQPPAPKPPKEKPKAKTNAKPTTPTPTK